MSPAIWNGSQDVALRLISEHSLIWRAANIGFALATIVTAAGLFLTPSLVGERGASLAWVSAVVFVLAAVPWLLTLATRLAVTPGVADGFVADGTVNPSFAPLGKLSGALFPAFILIASGSIVALGAAVIVGGSLGEPLGWACLVAGLAIGRRLRGHRRHTARVRLPSDQRRRHRDAPVQRLNRTIRRASDDSLPARRTVIHPSGG